MGDLAKGYDPTEVEARWYRFWEENGVFAASDDPADDRPVYVLPMPPPNVTGSLHIGHALRCTLEDTLVRYHRMQGKNTLWQPGIDHAGIATQTVVERELVREGKSRQAIGREAFLERVWKWKADNGGRIALQQRVLGVSPDWPRSKFTMDADMSRAVREAFVRLYEDGLMYRATRLINWCPECHTALSDLEVENEEGVTGELFEFAYRVDGQEGEVVVATTRPETMLGDTAVAVHPDDPRYTHLHGKMLVHPFVARKVPVITDAILVDPKFGTGAVKVTPAHDFNDFATGKRHGLAEVSIFNLDGTLNAERGALRRDSTASTHARAVKKALDELGLVRGSKPYTLILPKCQRSGGVVEPMISTQWFLKMQGMAEAALDAVKDGRDRDHPGGVEEDLRPLPREHPGLVRLAAALVGAPDPGVARPQRRGSRRPGVPRRVHRPRVEAGPGRTRHLVLERPLAILHPRLARRDPGARQVLPDQPEADERPGDGLRHPLLLGRAHDDVRPPLHEGGPVPPRAPVRAHRRRDRQQDEQGEGKCHRPSGPHLRRVVPGHREEDDADRARGRGARQVQEGLPLGGPDGAGASSRSARTPSASPSRPSLRPASASRSPPSASRATATSSTRSGTRPASPRGTSRPSRERAPIGRR